MGIVGDNEFQGRFYLEQKSGDIGILSPAIRDPSEIPSLISDPTLFRKLEKHGSISHLPYNDQWLKENTFRYSDWKQTDNNITSVEEWFSGNPNLLIGLLLKGPDICQK